MLGKEKVAMHELKDPESALCNRDLRVPLTKARQECIKCFSADCEHQECVLSR